jgi:hypothetical protein
MKVTLPYDDNWEALAWAKKNCPSYITNDATKITVHIPYVTVINYYFGNEKDAIMFHLRWL